MTETKTLDASIAAISGAIAAVMGEASRIPKNGRNKFHGYDYATEGDLLAVIRPAMAKHGLVLLPSQTSVSDPDSFGNVTVRVEYTLAHSSGAVWPEKLISYGVGNDRAKNGNDGDKAVYKAVTGANKYLMFKLFQVSTGDDPEAEDVANDDRPPRKEETRENRTTDQPAKLSDVEMQVLAFAGTVKEMLDQGAGAEDVHRFEAANKSRFSRMRENFQHLPLVKEVTERIDRMYEKAA